MDVVIAGTLAVVALLRTGAALLRMRRVGTAAVSGASAAAWVAVNAAWVAHTLWVDLLAALDSELCYLAW